MSTTNHPSDVMALNWITAATTCPSPLEQSRAAPLASWGPASTMLTLEPSMVAAKTMFAAVR